MFNYLEYIYYKKMIIPLIEHYNFTPSIIKESLNNGPLIVKGLLATVELKNGNGRYYKRELWERELKKYQQLIDERRSYGELDHPDSQIISLKNTSHIITNIYWEGDKIIGEIEILDTPSGNVLKALFERNCTVGISSRGMGSLKPMGENMLEVQDDFSLLCWDFVSVPSNPGSYMRPLNESLNNNKTDYSNINNILTNIFCHNGSCEI